MSIILPLNELTPTQHSEIKKDFTCKIQPSQFNPNTTVYTCFIKDQKTNSMLIPMRYANKYFDVESDGFPNGESSDFPRMNKNAKCMVKPLTKETDPKKRGRDQDVILKQALDHLKKHSTVFLALYTGYGKCLAPGTSILMFDGSKKNVEDILPGDVIMGDDSKPRNILSICDGEEELFEITPTKGENFTVNKSHILTLKASGQGRILKNNGSKSSPLCVHWFDGSKCTTKSFKNKEDALEFSKTLTDIFDIEVSDYLNLKSNAKHILKLFWAPVDYEYQEVTVDPRFLGIWLGDGTTSKTTITTIDSEIEEYIRSFAKNEGMQVSEYLQIRPERKIVKILSVINVTPEKTTFIKKNNLKEKMKELNLIGNKHIPLCYKNNSRQVRLELLAGLIDTDGYYCKGAYEITQKVKTLAYDIQDICRSLGFACFVYPCKKGYTYKGEYREGDYYRVSFYGHGLDEIPVLLNYKKGDTRNQIKDPLVTGFTIQSKGIGKYYGFEIDGNRRFLLGSYMVTHNTFIATNLSIALGLKTVVLCHLDSVRKQWPDEYNTFSGGTVKVQTVKGTGKHCKLDPTADVYIIGVMKASLMCREDFINIGTVIVDEAHLTSVATCTKTLFNFHPRYLIGLSATYDKGVVPLMEKFFGPVDNFIVRLENKPFVVYKVQTPFKPEIGYVQRYDKGQLKNVLDWVGTVVPSIEENPERWDYIIDEIVVKHPMDKMIILCKRNALALGLCEILDNCDEDYGRYIDKDKSYDRSKRISIVGMGKGGVGLNDPELTVAIIASDTQDVRQYEGRLRTVNCTVYHLVDNHPSFEKHWKLCEEWYLQKGATIKVMGENRIRKNKEPQLPSRRYV